MFPPFCFASQLGQTLAFLGISASQLGQILTCGAFSFFSFFSFFPFFAFFSFLGFSSVVWFVSFSLIPSSLLFSLLPRQRQAGVMSSLLYQFLRARARLEGAAVLKISS